MQQLHYLHVQVAKTFFIRSQNAVCLRLSPIVLTFPELAELIRMEEHVAVLQLYPYGPIQSARLRESLQVNALPMPGNNALCQLACT